MKLSFNTALLLLLSINLAYSLTVNSTERFEIIIENSSQYTNPVLDVTLNATLINPEKDTIKLLGFYDGGTTWKIRLRPEIPGKWNYNAVFSDGTPGRTGKFTSVKTLKKTSQTNADHGIIGKYEKNPIWFGYRGGSAVQVRSFHVGDKFFASNWPASERKAFLDWAQAQGYNMLSVASFFLNRDETGRGAGWSTPDLWPINVAEYQKAEAIIDDLANRNIIVYPFAGHFGQISDFPTNQSDQQKYIDYTIARFGTYWNIVFNVAGPEPLEKPSEFKNAMTSSDINRLGNYIAQNDPSRHLVSIHNQPGDDPFRNESWEGFITLQGAKDKNWTTISSYYQKNNTSTKPMYAQECLWPGNKHHLDSAWTDDEVRTKALVMLCSGATINFGDMNGGSSSGFSGSMKLSDRNQNWHDAIKKAWDFFETIPFYDMKPDQEDVNTGFCLAQRGTRYLVYLPNGGNVNVAVAGGQYDISWINPKNTSQKTNGGQTSDGKNLTPPQGSSEWLLYLVKSGTTGIKTSPKGS